MLPTEGSPAWTPCRARRARACCFLTSLSEPGGRVVSLGQSEVQVSGGGWQSTLTQISDADGTAREFAYDAGNRLTNDVWGPLDATFGYDSGTGLLNGVDRGLGSVYTISSAAAQGEAAGGAGPAWASVTDPDANTTQYLLDARGRLLRRVLPDGAAEGMVRDSAGRSPG